MARIYHRYVHYARLRGQCVYHQLTRAVQSRVILRAMATPKVITGYEPTGSNWQLISDTVFTRGDPGTKVVSGYQDFNLLTLLGKSLIGNYITMQQLHDQLSAKGYWIYYMGGWNNPPGGPFGAGIDTYRITWVRKA